MPRAAGCGGYLSAPADENEEVHWQVSGAHLCVVAVAHLIITTESLL